MNSFDYIDESFFLEVCEQEDELHGFLKASLLACNFNDDVSTIFEEHGNNSEDEASFVYGYQKTEIDGREQFVILCVDHSQNSVKQDTILNINEFVQKIKNAALENKKNIFKSAILNEFVKEAIDAIIADEAEIKVVLFSYANSIEVNNGNDNLTIYTFPRIIESWKSYIKNKEDYNKIEYEEYEEKLEDNITLDKEENLKISKAGAFEAKSDIKENFTLQILHPNNDFEKKCSYNSEQGDYIYTETKGVDNRSRKVLIATIPADQLISMRKKISVTLFQRNVREFLGLNDVNKNIIDTALNKPNLFFSYNNGINITCDKFTLEVNSEGVSVKVENPQVINGAQTLGSLHYAYEEKCQDLGDEKEALKFFRSAFVLCKIVESTSGDTTEYATNMTKFSNSQNKIVISDYFSSDKIHSDIAIRLKRCGIKYEYKRSPKKSSTELKNEGFGQTVKIEKLVDRSLYRKSIDNKIKQKDVFKIDGKGSSESKSKEYKMIFAPDGLQEKEIAADLLKSILIYDLVKKVKRQLKIVLNKGYFSELSKDVNKKENIEKLKRMLEFSLDLYGFESLNGISAQNEEEDVKLKIQAICKIEDNVWVYSIDYLLKNSDDVPKNSVVMEQIKNKKFNELIEKSITGTHEKTRDKYQSVLTNFEILCDDDQKVKDRSSSCVLKNLLFIFGEYLKEASSKDNLSVLNFMEAQKFNPNEFEKRLIQHCKSKNKERSR